MIRRNQINSDLRLFTCILILLTMNLVHITHMHAEKFSNWYQKFILYFYRNNCINPKVTIAQMTDHQVVLKYQHGRATYLWSSVFYSDYVFGCFFYGVIGDVRSTWNLGTSRFLLNYPLVDFLLSESSLSVSTPKLECFTILWFSLFFWC